MARLLFLLALCVLPLAQALVVGGSGSQAIGRPTSAKPAFTMKSAEDKEFEEFMRKKREAAGIDMDEDFGQSRRVEGTITTGGVRDDERGERLGGVRTRVAAAVLLERDGEAANSAAERGAQFAAAVDGLRRQLRERATRDGARAAVGRRRGERGGERVDGGGGMLGGGAVGAERLERDHALRDGD